jgi:hypothetical protein
LSAGTAEQWRCSTSKVIEVVLSDQLVADVEPVLVHGGMDLDDYILEAVTWYTRYLRQEPRRPFGFAQGMPGRANWEDSDAREQALLLRQIHEELAPYTVQVLQEALGEEEEDWEALLA